MLREPRSRALLSHRRHPFSQRPPKSGGFYSNGGGGGERHQPRFKRSVASLCKFCVTCRVMPRGFGGPVRAGRSSPRVWALRPPGPEREAGALRASVPPVWAEGQPSGAGPSVSVWNPSTLRELLVGQSPSLKSQQAPLAEREGLRQQWGPVGGWGRGRGRASASLPDPRSACVLRAERGPGAQGRPSGFPCVLLASLTPCPSPRRPCSPLSVPSLTLRLPL